MLTKLTLPETSENKALIISVTKVVSAHATFLTDGRTDGFAISIDRDFYEIFVQNYE
jgi:hypothetical protein